MGRDLSVDKCKAIFDRFKDASYRRLKSGKNPAIVLEVFLDELFPVASISESNYDLEQEERLRGQILRHFRDFEVKTDQDVADFWTSYFGLLGIQIPKGIEIRSSNIIKILWRKNIILTSKMLHHILETFSSSEFLDIVKQQKGLSNPTLVNASAFFQDLEHEKLVSFLGDVKLPELEEAFPNTPVGWNKRLERNLARIIEFCSRETEYVTKYGLIKIPYDTDLETLMLNQLDEDDFEYLDAELDEYKDRLASYLYLEGRELNKIKKLKKLVK